jgi:hypothetical protein
MPVDKEYIKFLIGGHLFIGTMLLLFTGAAIIFAYLNEWWIMPIFALGALCSLFFLIENIKEHLYIYKGKNLKDN